MSEVAEILRSARESKGLSITQVADATKMKSDHIRALEGGDYSVFTAPVFIRGFVRSYARYLKLDDSKLIQMLEIELGLDGVVSSSKHYSGGNRSIVDFLMYYLSQVKWRVMGPALIVGLILVSAVFGTRAWLDRKNKDPLANLPPAVYLPSSTKHAELLPLPQPKKVP